ncbi:MAG: ribokinase [Verrucomicrobia bacterium]|nr:ribokinase [Cytophagales bacterium]
MPKIIVIGSINTDMVIRTPQIPIPGQTVIGNTFTISGGGKGANQAVAAARLGGEVVLVAKIGEDSFGKQALQNLIAENIRTNHITVDLAEPTGVAMIAVDDNGENIILVAPGANATLMPRHVQAAEKEIAAADIVLLQLENPLETVLTAMKLAKKYKKTVILNPAPAQALSTEMLQHIDIITPNQLEALFLTDLFVEDKANAMEAADWLHLKGVPVVVVTMAEQGAYVSSENFKGVIAAHHVKKIIDTVAAGDTFSGALAVALAEKKSVPEAVHFANIAASLSVTRQGTQTAIPYRWEVDNLLITK